MKHTRAMSALLTCLVALLVLCSCTKKQDASAEAAVRGLRAYKVSAKAES